MTNEEEPADTLKSWNILNDTLADLTEEKVVELIEFEKTHRNRSYIIKRLHQRRSRLAHVRELEELLKGKPL